jgi:cell division transport system permease protein
MIKNFISQHIQALISSIRKLMSAPLANFMTIGVIAIALALPITLYVFLQNVKLIGHNWDDSVQLTLYLKNDVNTNQITMLMEQLNGWPQISKAIYISPEQGLKEFETQAGLGDSLTQLASNPLPPVIVISPSMTANTTEALHALVTKLQQLSPVDSVQLDMMWIQRLFAVIQFAKRVVWALGGLLGIAVLLIIGNTLRLAIQNSRHEIEVIKLVGGTNAFIRRPFLYTGILFGFIGALLALLVVNAVLFWLSEPIVRLVGLYQSNFHLSNLSLADNLFLIFFGIMLGLLGSWLAVSKQIAMYEPG